MVIQLSEPWQVQVDPDTTLAPEATEGAPSYLCK